MGYRSAEEQREWRRRNPGKASEYGKRARAKMIAGMTDAERKAFYKERSRIIRLRQLGLTEECYQDLLAAQHHKCAICPATTPGGHSKRWRIDHCHSTGKVRGLLCHRCNVALGLVDDSPIVLQNMITYLQR